MTPEMAAQVPGGCTPADPIHCQQAPGQTTQPGNWGPGAVGTPGAGAPPAINTPNGPGTLDVNLTVFRSDTLKPFPGAKVTVKLITYAVNTMAVSPDMPVVAQGATDANGKYFVHLLTPAPTQLHGYRVSIEKGTTESFPSKSSDVQGWQPNNWKSVDIAMSVCVAGVPDLVCEVGELQVLFTSAYQGQLAAWNYASAGANQPKVAAHAMDTAHYFVRNQRVRSAALAKYWPDLSWAVCDLGIPPTDFPALVKNYDQVMTIFNAIPWPSDGKIRDLFIRCARGIPVYLGHPIVDFRLYAPTYSDYFPREDYKIRAELAAAYLLNIHIIFQCMIEKAIAAAEKMKKHLNTLSALRLAAAFVFAPLTGGAMLTTLITETGLFVASQYQNNQIVGDVKGVVAGAAKNIGLGGAAVGAGLFAAGAALLIPELVKDSDPVVQKVASMFGPKVAEAAAKDVLDGVLPQGTVSGEGLISVQGLGTAGATLAVEAMLSLITLKGIRDAKAFSKTVTGVQDFILRCGTPDPDGHMCADIMPFVLWCVEAMMLDKFFDYVAQQAQIPGVNTNEQGIQPAAQDTRDQGISVPASSVTPGGQVGGATGSTAGGLAAVAGIGGGTFLALLLTGAFASR